jgi:HEAT repeat protein
MENINKKTGMMMHRNTLIGLSAFFLIILTTFNSGGLVKAQDTSREKLKTVLDELAIYDYDSRSWSEDLRHLMVEIYTSPKLKADAEMMMIDFLKSDATPAGKQVVCQHLDDIASSRSIEVLSEILGDENLAEFALHALENIPDKSVNKVLRTALKNISDVGKPGILLTIGRRNDAKSVKLLEEYTHHPDHQIAISAMTALGTIGDARAAKVLRELFLQYDPPRKWQVADHYLRAADRLYASGEDEKCFPIYDEVYNANPPLGLKIAALQGMLKDPILPAESVFVSILKQGDHSLIPAVMPLIRDYPASLDFKEFEAVITGIPEEAQRLLMIAFSGRKDQAVRPMALHSLKLDDPEFRMAGLISLANLAYPEDALTFAGKAAGSNGDEREFARKCLNELKGEETDRIILKAIPESETKIRVELIRSTGERNMTEATPILLDLASDEARSTRLEAVRALGVLGEPGVLPDLIRLLRNAPGRAERNELVKTITLVARKKLPDTKQADDLLAALPDIKDTETIIAVVEIFGNLGSDDTLPVLRRYLQDPEPEIQYAAIKALSNWPNDAPVMDLKQITEESGDLKTHTLALQGYLQLLSRSEEVEPDLKMQAYRKIFKGAMNNDEKRMILSSMGESGSINGFETAIKWMEDKDLRQEAQACFIKLLESVPDRYHEKKMVWMDEAIRRSGDDNFKDQLLQIMNEEN